MNRLACILAASILLLSLTVAAAPKRVVVLIENPGTFEVLHSRAESSATGMVFFGLIGYGVEESSRNSEDTKREESILPFIDDSACDAATLDALVRRLNEKGYDVEIREGKAKKAIGDAFVISVDVAACGFKMVDTTRDETSAFFAAQYQVLRPGQKRDREDRELIVTGEVQVPWESFESNGELANTELEAVRIKAGRRLANKLIYLKD